MIRPLLFRHEIAKVTFLKQTPVKKRKIGELPLFMVLLSIHTQDGDFRKRWLDNITISHKKVTFAINELIENEVSAIKTTGNAHL